MVQTCAAVVGQGGSRGAGPKTKGQEKEKETRGERRKKEKEEGTPQAKQAQEIRKEVDARNAQMGDRFGTCAR